MKKKAEKVKVKCKSCGVEYWKDARDIPSWGGDCQKCARGKGAVFGVYVRRAA